MIAVLLFACTGTEATPVASTANPPGAKGVAAPTLRVVHDSGAFDVCCVLASSDPPTDPGGLCGLRPAKVVARMEPPVQVAPRRWRFSGCVVSPGHVARDVTLVLRFPHSGTFVARVAERADLNQEFWFHVTVDRDSVVGVIAELSLNCEGSC